MLDLFKSYVSCAVALHVTLMLMTQGVTLVDSIDPLDLLAAHCCTACLSTTSAVPRPRGLPVRAWPVRLSDTWAGKLFDQ